MSHGGAGVARGRRCRTGAQVSHGGAGVARARRCRTGAQVPIDFDLPGHGLYNNQCTLGVLISLQAIPDINTSVNITD